VGFGAFAGGVDGLVLEEEQGVGTLLGDHGGVRAALQFPPLEVGDECGGEAFDADVEHGAP
jgi:hypothetical protein